MRRHPRHVHVPQVQGVRQGGSKRRRAKAGILVTDITRFTISAVIHVHNTAHPLLHLHSDVCLLDQRPLPRRVDLHADLDCIQGLPKVEQPPQHLLQNVPGARGEQRGEGWRPSDGEKNRRLRGPQLARRRAPPRSPRGDHGNGAGNENNDDVGSRTVEVVEGEEED